MARLVRACCILERSGFSPASAAGGSVSVLFFVPVFYGVGVMKTRVNRGGVVVSGALQEGGIVLALGIVLAAILILCVMVFWVFGKIVPPNYIGVRQNYFALGVLKVGYGNIGLEPGLHWRIPGISNVILLPRGFQTINFNTVNEGADLVNPAPFEVQAKDGPKVKVDVTFVVRLYPRPDAGAAEKAAEGPVLDANGIPFAVLSKVPHGGPRDLINAYRKDPKEQLRRISPIAENELRKSLAELGTAEFYDGAKRETATLKAVRAINEKVAADGIEVWAALIRRYVYADRNIDDQIFAKNLQQQTEQLNRAASAAAAARAETVKNGAIGDARIKSLEVDGEAKVRELRSQGELEEAKQKAEGDKQAALARAAVDEQKARVLHEVPGADLYVAREMAPLLRSVQGGVLTDVDPYDVRSWIQKLTSRGAQ